MLRVSGRQQFGLLQGRRALLGMSQSTHRLRLPLACRAVPPRHLMISAFRSIIAIVNAWLDTWSAEIARRGEMPTVSAWLGIDVDQFSEPVLAGAPAPARLDARDRLLDARARCASALLGTHDGTHDEARGRGRHRFPDRHVTGA